MKQHRRVGGYPGTPYGEWHPEGPCCRAGDNEGQGTSFRNEFRDVPPEGDDPNRPHKYMEDEGWPPLCYFGGCGMSQGNPIHVTDGAAR